MNHYVTVDRSPWLVTVERDRTDGGYIASCPALKGCHSQGESVAEALENVKDAIAAVVGEKRD